MGGNTTAIVLAVLGGCLLLLAVAAITAGTAFIYRRHRRAQAFATQEEHAGRQDLEVRSLDKKW
jgi:hypothetical protein